MGADHFRYFSQGITFFFFHFQNVLMERREKRPVNSACHLPLWQLLSQCISRKKDNKASNWQGSPSTPFLSPTTWPCPIYLFQSPLVPHLFTKLLKSCPLESGSLLCQDFYQSFHLNVLPLVKSILKQERTPSLKHLCCQSPSWMATANGKW